MSPGVEVRAQAEDAETILTPEALELLEALHREFDAERIALLAAREERRSRLAAGEIFDFLSETASVRDEHWRVGEVPPDLQDRRVEITGPTDAKMLINALNSGARCFMADFEDANSPTWENMIGGQANLREAVGRTLTHAQADGRTYKLNDQLATLIVRPRGWHLVEKHLSVDGEPISGSLFDFGLYLFHNAAALEASGSGPYFYLPKLESHVEARLWSRVLVFAEDSLGLARGTIKVTVLVETLPAAFEMDEILFELRDHIVGLNAGRWDYIFSAIKSFPERPEFVLPDRNDVRMTVPFMHAYTELIVKTCHRRGAHAMGGMSALIPSRRDAEANAAALDGVREDKRREAGQGFDGTWVAHPDLVPVATEEFDAVLGERPNQVDRLRDDVQYSAADLLNVGATPGEVTDAGLRNNVSVGILYIASWLRGNGAAAINSLMEDAATAEIARSQIWQWMRHGTSLASGELVDAELVRRVIGEEVARITDGTAPDELAASRIDPATRIFEGLVLEPALSEFLTLPAYELLD